MLSVFPSHFTESIITGKSSVTQVFMVRLKPAYARPPLSMGRKIHTLLENF
jgi:hypothetical protein